MRNEIVKAVNKLCEELDSAYYINAGGCCYCASLIARELETRKIKYKLIIYDHSTRDVSPLSIRRDIRSRNKRSDFNDIMFCGSHYAIMLQNGEILNSGDYSSRYPHVAVCYINSKHIRWMYDKGDWNRCYDTKYNSIVAKRIKQVFKKYEEL